MTLSRRRVVQADAQVTAAGLSRGNKANALFLTTDTTVLAGAGSGKVKSYANLAELQEDYASTSEPYLAAAKYFGQKIHPDKILIGNWAQADVNHRTRGAAPDTVANIEAITDGSFSFGGQAFNAVSFDADATYADIAATLQAAIRTHAAFAAVTVTYEANPGRLVINTPPSIALTADNAFLTEGAAGTTDVNENLGLDPDGGGTFLLGKEAEDVGDALGEIRRHNPDFYVVTIEKDYNDNLTAQTALSTWVNADRFLGILEFNDEAVLTTGESASVAAQISALGARRTMGVWSGHEDYKALSVAGYICGVNLNAAGTSYTLKFKTLPGTTADNLDSEPADELDRKRLNYSAGYEGNTAFLAEGVNFDDESWTDVVVWADWFVDRMEREVLGELRRRLKVPQTSDGRQDLKTLMGEVCEAGIANGGIAPGEVESAVSTEIINTTGDDGFDGNLHNGYLNYVGSFAAQSQSDREQRTAPPMKTWLKGSGAIHDVSIIATLEQ